MDPNQALKELRSLVAEYDRADEHIDLTDELVSLFAGLDGWLSGGGFLPKAWEAKR